MDITVINTLVITIFSHEGVICFVECAFRYVCLTFSDHFVTFVDICTNTTKTDDKDMQLISSVSMGNSKQCQCSIRGAGFSFILNDVRLTSGTSNLKRKCAPVTLKILSLEYSCASENGVFNTQLDAPSATANISLRSTARDILPEMIWITVQPKGMHLPSRLNMNFDLLHTSFKSVVVDLATGNFVRGFISVRTEGLCKNQIMMINVARSTDFGFRLLILHG